jgi:hypothetical protein
MTPSTYGRAGAPRFGASPIVLFQTAARVARACAYELRPKRELLMLVFHNV